MPENHRAEPIAERLTWAATIAQEAGNLTLTHFRGENLSVEHKADNSPVTLADREAEKLLRTRIAEKFSHDAILGEEFGETEGTSGFQWVLDPIDGTKSFIHGVPLYTTLVAVLAEGEPKIGVIHAPATGETVYAALGLGCSYVNKVGAQSRPARVSQIATLENSLVLTTDVACFSKSRSPDALAAFLKLQQTARLCRTWGDGYGYLLVATGRAEAMIDPEMNLWDTAALLPVIEEAGGHFRDWQGHRTIHSRDSLATNGRVTREILARLQ